VPVPLFLSSSGMTKLATVSAHELEMQGCRIRFLRASPARADQSALLLHGLGDDHTAFPEEVITHLARTHEVIVPDLVGFGGSRGASDFDHLLTTQAAILEKLLDLLDIPGPVLLIGHSLGGALATLLAAGCAPRISAFVNVEGNLCEEDCFLSSHAVHAGNTGHFHRWWRLLPAASRRREGDVPAVSRYLKAVSRAEPDAFLASSRDVLRLTRTAVLAETYRTLPVRRIYFHGETHPREKRKFLQRYRLETAPFAGAPHWLIEHDPQAFLTRLCQWLAEQR